GAGAAGGGARAWGAARRRAARDRGPLHQGEGRAGNGADVGHRAGGAGGAAGRGGARAGAANRDRGTHRAAAAAAARRVGRGSRSGRGGAGRGVGVSAMPLRAARLAPAVDVRPAVLADVAGLAGLMEPFVASGDLLPRSAYDLSRHIREYVVVEADDAVVACGSLK